MPLEYPFTFPYINFQAFYSFSIWNSLAHIYSTIFASLNVIGKNHISTPHAYLHKTTPICPPQSVGTSCCVTIVLLGSNTIDQYYFFGTLRNHLWACLMGCTLVNNVPRTYMHHIPTPTWKKYWWPCYHVSHHRSWHHHL